MIDGATVVRGLGGVGAVLIVLAFIVLGNELLTERDKFASRQGIWVLYLNLSCSVS
jgi:hypothetical protein